MENQMNHTGRKSILKFLYKYDEAVRLKNLFEDYKEKTDYKGDYNSFTTFISRLSGQDLVKKPKRGFYKIAETGRNAVKAWEKEGEKPRDNYEYDDKFEDILEKEFKEKIAKALHEDKHFYLDLNKLAKKDYELAEMIEEDPLEEYRNLEEAFKRVQKRNFHKDKWFKNTESHIFFSNIPGFLNSSIVSAKSSKKLGNLVAVEGMVVQKTELYPVIDKTVFTCLNCGDEFEIEHDGEFEKPDKCPCGSRSFEVKENSYEDVFSVWVQENMDDEVGQSDDIQVVFRGKYVDEKLKRSFTVGDQVKVVGVPKDTEADKKGLKRTVYIKGMGFDQGELSWDNVEVSEKDKKQLKNIDRKDFINSHAPHLVGEDAFLMRKSVVTGVVGAHDRMITDRKKMSGNIHVLLLTPPSEGKSDVLKDSCDIYPRSEYADCTNSTPTGLIASAEKSEDTGEWRLKAKTLVKANKGVACLDEFDNLSDGDKKGYEKLNEAMESQQATIEKATISTSLPTDCSVIAAANPKHGDFSEHEPVSDQFPNAAASTLSRFSLQVVSKGVQKRENDMKVADSMQGFVEKSEVLDKATLRKYVKFAKSFRPEWTDECRERVTGFYADVREKSDRVGEKVRSRLVRTVQNVATSFARMDFCEEVGVGHVDEAIELLVELFRRKGFDLEGGEFDVDLVDGGKGRKNFEKSALLSILPNNGDGMAIGEIYDSFDVSTEKVDELLDELLDHGEIVEQKKGLYKKG